MLAAQHRDLEAPVRALLPDVIPSHAKFLAAAKRNPFALLGVNSDIALERAKTAMKENDLTWRSFWNGPQGTGGPLAQAWDVMGWPTIYILDGDGIIRVRNRRNEEMRTAVLALVAEAEQRDK